MANRFPLVIDNNSTLVAELQPGDSLNLSGNGIFDGVSTGSTGYVLSSNGSSGVSWTRAADVYTTDNQTLSNKTLSSCTIDCSLNTISNIPNTSLTNNSITFQLTRDGIAYTEEIQLGGTYSFEDTNDNTTYSISVVGGNNAYSEKLRLTAGGSGNSIQDVVFTVDDAGYLSISRLSADEMKITASLTTLTNGSYITGGSYNGLTARTWDIDATPGTSTNVGASKVVARDANGNFYAGTITATLNGTATKTSASLTFGSYVNAVQTGTSTAVTSYDGSVATTISAISSSASTPNTLVLRDASGDFSANDISCRNFTATNTIEAATVKVTSGTASQFLMADGTKNSTSYFENINTSNGYGKRYISISPPSNTDGDNGDIWYVIA